MRMTISNSIAALLMLWVAACGPTIVGHEPDASATDAGQPDRLDAGSTDAGALQQDAGGEDGGGLDAGAVDGGGVDAGQGHAATPRVLLFVPPTEAWWSEFKVMREGLRGLGYEVEIRSSRVGPLAMSMNDGDVQQSANAVAGSSYAQFKADFQSRFGATFDDAWAPVGTASATGRVQDVVSMQPYAALVVVGGVGALEFRYDGTWSGPEQQSAAEALNRLAAQALSAGIPVLAQCHAATLAAFFRVPGTQGGHDGLGTSVLAGRAATGYHLSDGDTAARLAQLGVTWRPLDSLVVDGPVNVAQLAEGAFKVLTSRDWHPQTVAHAATTLHRVLTTTPPPSRLRGTTSVLVLHGGRVNVADCSASNRANDVPCNYGTSPVERVPADASHVLALLRADSLADGWSFTTSDLDLTAATLPFDPNDAAAVAGWLRAFDVVLFFKHWNTGVTPALQAGLASYVDDGGGLVALHHALYNDRADGGSKDGLTSLFGADSAAATFAARDPSQGPYLLFNVNAGHFISTWGLTYDPPGATRPPSLPAALANVGPVGVPAFQIVDELYLNLAFAPGVQFGSGLNQVDPLFANDRLSGAPAFTSGFTRHRDLNGDGVAGRLVYLQAAERRTSLELPGAAAQAVRNAVTWAARGQ